MISRSSCSRRCTSASTAPRASSSVACAAGCASVTVLNHCWWRVVHASPSSNRIPWRNSSFESRCRQRIRSTRTASRARTRSRSASSSRPGTRTGCSLPASSNRASSSASRRSVLTRSPDPRGIFDGAATTHPTSRRASSRASPYPVGPASYAARTGPGSPAQNPATPAISAVIEKNASSPVSTSNTAATTFVACTSRPTRVLAFAMAGSCSEIPVRQRPPSARG